MSRLVKLICCFTQGDTCSRSGGNQNQISTRIFDLFEPSYNSYTAIIHNTVITRRGSNHFSRTIHSTSQNVSHTPKTRHPNLPHHFVDRNSDILLHVGDLFLDDITLLLSDKRP